MASKISINLDTSKENYLVSKCKQNDDLVLEAFIHDKGLELDLTNKEITIQALKADNTYIIQNTDIVKENNKIIANLVKDFTRVPGETKIEIVLVESSKQNTTFSFTLEVIGSVIRRAVQSSNTATILEALDNKIIEARQVKQETEELVQSGGAATKGEVQEINAHLEQNKNNLQKIYGLSDISVHYYVNAKIGDDSTGDGTVLKPYKTIQKAFDSIPKIVDKRQTVHIARGTYDEDCYLTGVVGGSIYIELYDETPPDVNNDVAIRVRSMGFYDIMGYINIADVGPAPTTPQTSKDGFLLFSRCIYASVGKCRFDVDLTTSMKNTLRFDGSIGSVKTSYFINQHICTLSIRGASVRIDPNCTIGGNCTYGIFAQSGLIWKNGDVKWIKNATIPEREHEGGRIFGRNEYSWNEISYQNGWETASGVPLKFRSQGGIGLLYGFVTKTPIDTTIIGKLPYGFKPINTQRFTVYAAGTSSKQDATLNISADGNISVLNVGNITTNIILISVTFPLG